MYNDGINYASKEFLMKFSMLLATLLVGVSCAHTTQEVASFDRDTVFLDYGDKQVTVGDLSTQQRDKLYEIERKRFDEIIALARTVAVDQYLRAEAQKKHKSTEQLREELLTVKTPSDTELDKYIEDHRESIPYEIRFYRNELKNYYLKQKRDEKEQEIFSLAEKNTSIRVNLLKPQSPQKQPVINGFPSLISGKEYKNAHEKSKIEIVQFLDYECPFCRAEEKNVKKIIEKFGDQVEFIAIALSKSNSPVSLALARASICAAKFGSYKEYRQLALKFYGKAEDIQTEFPKKLSLSPQDWTTCMTSQETQQKLFLAETEAHRLNVGAVPKFFINGKINTGLNEMSIREEFDQQNQN